LTNKNRVCNYKAWEKPSHPNKTMKAFTILGHEFSTVKTLEDFANIHGFMPIGKKPLKAAWVESVRFYLESQAIVIAVVVEADPIASEIATTIEVAAVSVGTVVVKVLTSDAAVLGYRVVLKSVAFALVMAWLLSVAAVKWCWQHRSSTAIYHWIKAAIESEATQYAIVYLILGQWVLNEWVDSVRSAVNSIMQTCRVWGGGIVGEARSVVG